MARQYTENQLKFLEVLFDDANGDVAVTAVTATELGHLDGVADNVQTHLDAKATTAFAIAQAVALG